MTAAVRRYVELLQRWNRHISLTSLEDTREILERHFGESLFAVHAAPISHGRLADVGSGGGFPGIPIKMAVPEVDLVLIESNARKAAFLSEVTRILGLAGVSIINKRVEEIDSLAGSLDFVVARALGSIPTLLNWARSSLRTDGKVALWLGTKDSKEVSSSPRWKWRLPILVSRSENRVILVGQKLP
jgi:16S rRNA (guanine527-N7)-methyltransferase